MTDRKLYISRVEINGSAYPPCRVFLSDGSELCGLQRVNPREVMIDDHLTVQIDALIGMVDRMEGEEK